MLITSSEIYRMCICVCVLCLCMRATYGSVQLSPLPRVPLSSDIVMNNDNNIWDILCIELYIHKLMTYSMSRISYFLFCSFDILERFVVLLQSPPPIIIFFVCTPHFCGISNVYAHRPNYKKHSN